MPTAAKLVASFAFFVIGYLAAQSVAMAQDAGTDTGNFSLIVGGIGFFCGWLVMGNNVDQSYWRSGGAGVRTASTIVVFALVGFAGREMIHRSMQRSYKDVIEAVQGFLVLFGQDFQLVLKIDTLLILVGGGFLAGMLAEWTARRWR